jgi:hypothetical protein
MPTAETGKTKKRRPKSKRDTSIGGKSMRTFAWQSNFRRLVVVCYDRLITVYSGFFHLACIIIALRQF